jgi:pimeloyl-ACP methyl ester carboxylesterase
MMLTQKTFANTGVPLNYMEGPDNGPPLLLLHGITQRWQGFVQILPALTQSYHVYAPDLRGHGRSARAKGHYRGEDYGRDALAFIDEVIGGPTLLFGHSLGGMISLYLSANFPGRLRAQVLGDSIILGNDLSGTVLPSMFAQVRDIIASGMTYDEMRRAISEMCLESPLYGKVPFKAIPGFDDPYLAAWARCLSMLDPDVLSMALDGRAFQGWQPAEWIKKIQCPTLLIQADPKMGGLTSDEAVQALKNSCPGVQVARMTGIGHPLHMYEAGPVVRALTNFLVTLE